MQDKLLNQFQLEFPNLDSALLHALVSDLEDEPSEEQTQALHLTLSELAAQADALAEDFGDPGLTDESTTSLSFTNYGTSTTSSMEFLNQPFDTPLGFLQAAFPDIQNERLHRAIVDAEKDIDMWDVVARILSEESIREMEERGFDGLDDSNEHIEKETVGKKPLSAASKKDKAHKITLVDIRQQQHTKHSASSNPSPSLPAPDPWTQISSLSTHLASLIPSQQPSFFATYFHSPKYPTPYLALVEALHAISKTYSTKDDEYTPMLISLLHILLPVYENLDPEQHSRLVSNIELSLNATRGRPDETLDLVHLLRDLDEDASGYLEMGIYHQPAATRPSPSEARLNSNPGNPASTPVRNLQPSSHSPPVTPLPFLNSTSENKPNPYQWQSVPQRKPPKKPHTHAAYIPAYTRGANGTKVRGSGNGFGKGGKGDVGELDFRRRIGHSMRKRNEMLREASRMWQKGSAKSRGGEVALYFAERAREFQELAKKEALEAARVMVETKRMSSNDQGTIDLHGTTASEAIIIASETLASTGCSSSKPLKIITGRGTHSANQVSVLKPALHKALVEDGWIVEAWDGGLIVKGRRSV